MKKLLCGMLSLILIFNSLSPMTRVNAEEYFIESQTQTFDKDEIMSVFNSNSDDISYILTEKLSRDYSGQKIYVGEGFRAPDYRTHTLSLGDSLTDECYFPIYNEKAEVIGILTFAKSLHQELISGKVKTSYKTTLSYQGISDIKVTEINFYSLFPELAIMQAINETKKNPTSRYIIFRGDNKSEDFFSCMIDDKNNVAVLKSSKEGAVYVPPDGLSFDFLSQKYPCSIITANLFTLDKSTAAAFEIKS